MDGNFKNKNFSNSEYQNQNSLRDHHDQNNNKDESDLDTDNLLANLGREIENIEKKEHNTSSVSTTKENTQRTVVQPKTESTSQTTGSINDDDLPIVFRYFPDLIKEMYISGINFSINQLGEIIISDFYKPDTIKMTMHEDETFSVTLKRKEIKIETMDDLIDLNYKEWKKTGGAKGNYDFAAKCWTDLFSKKGLVKKQMVFTPVDD